MDGRASSQLSFDMSEDHQDLLGYDGVNHPEMEEDVIYHQPHVSAHQCPTCCKYFTNVKGLQQHMIIHTDQRPFSCDICNQTFRFKSNLFEHTSVHTGSMPYSCPYCQKQCRLKGNLKKHLRTHVTTKEELEAAWRPFAKADPQRRKSTPYGPQFIKREPFTDVQDDNSVLYGASSGAGTSVSYSVPRLRKKTAGLGTADDWIRRIKTGKIMPQVDLEEKVARFEHYIMTEHSQYSGYAELLEVAKTIAFETHHCPVCNLLFMNKVDCQNHCNVQHISMRSKEYFCEKCFRLFMDKNSFQQHQAYHQRVTTLIEQGAVPNATTEPEMVLPESDQLQDIIQSAMQTMMLQQQEVVGHFEDEVFY